ncbi:hypothetical protein Y1Q_0017757 [Alligator mississippiensis]|uniref:Uncharacterized protein n=1 Tax=Alligator mississippiensis TaxID=8496 RepID=A0A151M3S1_ALLMI|nr:hypothetical protein Y1Q_0017757 [Alligator mississippiensis]
MVTFVFSSSHLKLKLKTIKRVVYGITTGFGKFARTVIPNSKLKELQVNLVCSHSAGVRKPLSPERSRKLLALRINVRAKGYNGIYLETAASF